MREREHSPHRRESGVRTALGWWRLALTAVEIVALLGNFAYVLGFSAFGSENFFCYFTIQSAISAVPMLLGTGILALSGRVEPRWVATVRTIVLVYLLLSGIVFALIVTQASTRDYRVDVPWSDQLLHFVMPVLVLADWLVDRFLAARTRPVPAVILAWVFPFPIVWLIFTLWRGDRVGWYPYFFLDETQVGGPLGIVGYCAIVAVFVLVLTGAFVLLSRARYEVDAPDARTPTTDPTPRALVSQP